MFLHDIKDIKNGRIITRDAEYENYYDVGKDVGLSGEKLIQYVDYMRQRWPNKEKNPLELQGYCKDWARRFLNGMAWKLSDLEGQKILERMGIYDSKTKDATYYITIKEGGGRKASYENHELIASDDSDAIRKAKQQYDSPDRGEIITLSKTSGGPAIWTIKGTSDRALDSKTKDGGKQNFDYKGFKIIIEDLENGRWHWAIYKGFKKLDEAVESSFQNAKQYAEDEIEMRMMRGNYDSKTKDEQIAELESQKKEARKQGYGTDAYEAKIEELQKDKY